MKSKNYKPAIAFYEIYLENYIDVPKHFILELENYEVYVNLAECYEKEKNIEKAAYYRQKAYNIREEAINEGNNHLLASYFVKDQTYNKEAENIFLKEKLQRYLIVFLIIASLVIMWMLLRRERIKRIQAENYFKGMEIEKDRIGKELHEHVASELSAIIRFDATIGATITEQFIDRLSELRNYIRGISHKLSLPSFKYSTFYAVLEDYLKQRTDTDIRFDLTTNNKETLNMLPQNYMFESYRIIQESVNNILKYANATEGHISFYFRKRSIPLVGKKTLTLTITDNGTGFNTEQVKSGIGLKNIQERAETLGGTYKISSQIGKGTQITIFFSSFFHRKK